MDICAELFSLLRSEICEAQLDEETKNAITPETLSKLYKLSKKHDLAHLVADALDKNGLLPTDGEIKKRFLYERNMAVYRYEQINYELGEICRVLEEEQIEHIPLKGSVLRRYYPEPWMRTSCDIDILVKEADLKKARSVLVEKLDYKYDGENMHDVQLWAPSGVHLELHFDLVEDYIAKKATPILHSVWERTKPYPECNYRLEMTDEMFYFYHLAHMGKHFIYGGCGIRSFLDVWVLTHKITYHEENRAKLLKKGGLYQFAIGVENLSDVWFEEKAHTPMTLTMETYILQGGIYGTNENKSLLGRGKKGNKIKYIAYRIFMPYGELCCIYPRLAKRKWLYPFYTVKRWFTRLFQGKLKKSINEAKTVSNLQTEKIDNMKELLANLGLDK